MLCETFVSATISELLKFSRCQPNLTKLSLCEAHSSPCGASFGPARIRSSPMQCGAAMMCPRHRNGGRCFSLALKQMGARGAMRQVTMNRRFTWLCMCTLGIALLLRRLPGRLCCLCQSEHLLFIIGHRGVAAQALHFSIGIECH